jgi:phage nucleotide-binding protein
LQVESVTDDADTGLNILIYGDSGVGKTVLSGSASVVPEMSPVLHIDVEGGTLSLKTTYPDVKRVRVKAWDDLQRIYNDLYDGKLPYRTVILDSLTELQRFSMDQIMADAVKERENQDPDVPAQRDWGKNQNQIRFFVRAFRDLPCNAIFTALAQERQEKSGLTKTKPDLPGKLANQVAGFLDEVLYYYIKNVDGDDQRLILTQQTGSKVAKDRSGLLPQVIESPTMADIYTLITSPPVKEKQNEG